MKIYIAGPYTKGDVAENVRNAIYEADYVTRLGHIPFIPHLTHFWHMLIPHTYDFWMHQDEQWLLSCDALLRLKGESAGADHEVKRARELGLRVFYSVFEIPKATNQKVKVMCECKDWKESSRQIFDAQVRYALNDGIEYSGAGFKYCPWCGKELELHDT